jgi:hypothetical protein
MKVLEASGLVYSGYSGFFVTVFKLAQIFDFFEQISS